MQHPIDPMRIDLPSVRKPVAEDGAKVWELVQACKPLDENSMYCNLLQSDHFADTCCLAELSQEMVGWVSAYVLPNDPDTLFVWQIAVAENARGRGLGSMMLQSILRRPQCKDVNRLQTTITADNYASWSLFRRFASFQDSQMDIQPYYTQALHFQERHKTENLVTIPLIRQQALAA